MAEPQDAVVPMLIKIQQEISAGRKDTKALQGKVNDFAETALEIREDIADTRRDLKSRKAALEAR